MKVEMDAKLVTIYINSTDQWHGQPLYTAIVHACKDHGVSGVTVLRAIEGFGGSGRLHTARLLELSENLPVLIEIVDVPERIEPLLMVLNGMIGEGLVTITNVHILRYLREPKH